MPRYYNTPHEIDNAPCLVGYRIDYWEVQAVVLNRGRLGEAMLYSTLVRPSGAEAGFFCDFREQAKKEGAEC